MAPQRTQRQREIDAIRARYEGITPREIAAIMGTTATNVNALSRYKSTGKRVGRPKGGGKRDPRKFAVWRAGSPRTATVSGYRLPSLANSRTHWSIKAKQRELGARMANVAISGCAFHADKPCTITLTRIGVRLLDSDNLASAFKHVRDGIADALGVDDGPEGPITWRYEQRKGAPSITCEVSP